MNVLTWIIGGAAIGAALYFLIVGALWALAITLVRYSKGYNIAEVLPHPETGQPIRVTGTLRFRSRLSALLYAITGKLYAQTIAWPGAWVPAICLPDFDIAGTTLYHELVVHGLAWRRLTYRFPFLQSRAVVVHGYRANAHEEHGYRYGTEWGEVTPSYRLESGRLIREFANQKARDAWEITHGLKERPAA